MPLFVRSLTLAVLRPLGVEASEVEVVKPHNKRKKATPRRPRSKIAQRPAVSRRGNTGIVRTPAQVGGAFDGPAPVRVARFDWSVAQVAPEFVVRLPEAARNDEATRDDEAARDDEASRDDEAARNDEAARDDEAARNYEEPRSNEALAELSTPETLVLEPPAREESTPPPAADLEVDLDLEVPEELKPEPTPVFDAAAELVRRKKARNRALFVGLSVFIVGAVFSAWIGRNIASDAKTHLWPLAPGKVTVSQRELISRNPDRFVDHFVYEYKAAGRWFTARRVRFAGGAGDPIKTHRAGDPLKVYYDPQHPEVAVLEPGVIRWAWLQLVFGLVVAALGGMYIVLSRGGRHV